MINPLRYVDILNLADVMKESDAFDIDFDDELNNTIGNAITLSEDDKCILGLALLFYSKRIDAPKDSDKAHEFCLHDAYASACYMEELAHTVIGDHIDVLKQYPSPAMFVNTITDAAFVVMNSMSRGFNVGYIKRFGGDAHLRFITGLFDIIICLKYARIFYDETGFKNYKEFHLDKLAKTGCAYNERDARLMYARFATWLRNKMRVARKCCYPLYGLCVPKVVTDTISLLRHKSEEQAKMADLVNRAQRSVQKPHSKPVDFPKEDSDHEDEPAHAKSRDVPCGMENRNDDLCHWIHIKWGDDEFELNYDFNKGRFEVDGHLTSSNVAMLKRKGFIPGNFELSNDGKFLLPVPSRKIHIN